MTAAMEQHVLRFLPTALVARRVVSMPALHVVVVPQAA
jgi:hypothetical protein